MFVHLHQHTDLYPSRPRSPRVSPQWAIKWSQQLAGIAIAQSFCNVFVAAPPKSGGGAWCSVSRGVTLKVTKSPKGLGVWGGVEAGPSLPPTAQSRDQASCVVRFHRGDAGGMACHPSPWQPWGPLLTLVTLHWTGLEKMLQVVQGPFPACSWRPLGKEGPVFFLSLRKGRMGVYLHKAS